MHFSAHTIAVLLAAGAAAQDSYPQMQIQVSNIVAHHVDGVLSRASLTIQPDNINCAAADPALLASTAAIPCDNFAAAGLSFDMRERENQPNLYTLAVHKALEDHQHEIYNRKNITLECHKGTESEQEYICTPPTDQSAPLPMTLTLSGGPHY